MVFVVCEKQLFSPLGVPSWFDILNQRKEKQSTESKQRKQSKQSKQSTKIKTHTAAQSQKRNENASRRPKSSQADGGHFFQYMYGGVVGGVTELLRVCGPFDPLSPFTETVMVVTASVCDRSWLSVRTYVYVYESTWLFSRHRHRHRRVDDTIHSLEFDQVSCASCLLLAT